ncbi:hypothetical protein PAXRUDRAFT_148451 [Paxillus rubicundulus Ve08.2h10]|uniref:DUF202 domain-containing protein n=1 Tax=Paxillus rubicundulus Ve08.2h10 TaxID=930991 RepID=A0A0D0DTJ5_9AGAM|nr:hypothetical protein PAXRUDRAFT_148451 [Paxillus rubicundulus Ve08.2h10]
MPLYLEIVGSMVRDFCMLERNFLSHFKLVLLLMLLTSSALLGTRLPASPGSDASQAATLGKANFPVAIIQFIAALAAIAAAFWEYHTGVKDLMRVRAFFIATKIHLSLMVLMTTIVVATSLVYVVST